jgi:mannan endo-1,4-beta-mannosidase
VIEIIVVLFLWLKAWIAEMAAYIKSLDKRHLVTVGLEGFYGLNTTNKSEVNPGIWAASLGSDFIPNSAISNIDFASVHAYPDSWLVIHFQFIIWQSLVD